MKVFYDKNTFVISDVNECTDDNGGCDHICTDTEGAYTCSCREGYELQADGAICEGRVSSILDLISVLLCRRS